MELPSQAARLSLLTVKLTVMGIPCLGPDGGPTFTHNEAFSFQVATAGQADTDHSSRDYHIVERAQGFGREVLFF